MTGSTAWSSAAGLSARQTTILRLYCKVLRQAGSTFSQSLYGRDAGDACSDRARASCSCSSTGSIRQRVGNAAQDVLGDIQAIDHALDAVESLDEDRILRAFLTLILKSVRTNYYQHSPVGRAEAGYCRSSSRRTRSTCCPLPRPLYEIYVYSPRIEGVHMRAGKVARGGIRWSDRKEDFRTEILGLMKAQTVKNAVIVPVGSKGGFVLKRPPGRPATIPRAPRDRRDRMLQDPDPRSARHHRQHRRRGPCDRAAAVGRAA